MPCGRGSRSSPRRWCTTTRRADTRSIAASIPRHGSPRTRASSATRGTGSGRFSTGTSIRFTTRRRRSAASRSDDARAVRERDWMIVPPVEPMLAKLAEAIPSGAFLYEPKWDGFRAIVFRSPDGVFIQSRDLRPLDRYFPELHDVLLTALPDGCVVDGEIVIARAGGVDFEALQMRLPPAASRVGKLAKETPASFVAFDLLASGGSDLRELPFAERRALLERALEHAPPPVHLTPTTRDIAVARKWLDEFEGAGLDGVIAKPEGGTYEPGKRAMIKIKHARTVDCVVAGFRWHKDGKNERIGSLLLGLYDDGGRLHHVGVTSSFTMTPRRGLVRGLA